MAKKKKEHFLTIAVSAPADMSAVEVRRELRRRVNDPSDQTPNEGGIRAVKVSTFPKGAVISRCPNLY
ncbi:MAG: hypothetical protein ABJN42_24825 [Roseibium sp.]|uniref:hypothetical protein n=1 Tax=Roseibium sp. TaxID=1936156 RepID=UPI0032968C0F